MFGITCVIPTSPIPSHPSTAILDETISSIRFHMPEARIIVMADGLRDEQDDLLENYDLYLRRILHRGNERRLGAIRVFNGFQHQVGMMRMILPQIQTELLLWCEHDTPLVTDEPIDWYGCCAAIESGDVNLIRFLHEAHILSEHEHLMLEQIESHGVPLRKTIQFSARPHLASVAFYRKLLERFSPNAKCFLEDAAHSFCQSEPWADWRLSIYNPAGNAKRSLHSDGRAGGPKFDDAQVF